MKMSTPFPMSIFTANSDGNRPQGNDRSIDLSTLLAHFAGRKPKRVKSSVWGKIKWPFLPCVHRYPESSVANGRRIIGESSVVCLCVCVWMCLRWLLAIAACVYVVLLMYHCSTHARKQLMMINAKNSIWREVHNVMCTHTKRTDALTCWCAFAHYSQHNNQFVGESVIEFRILTVEELVRGSMLKLLCCWSSRCCCDCADIFVEDSCLVLGWTEAHGQITQIFTHD